MMPLIVREIIAAKNESGPDAFLWVHSVGDAILWPTKEASVDDDGQRALARWALRKSDIERLIACGVVDEVA